MANFENKLEELGLTKNNLSKGLVSAIKDYYDGVKEYEKVKEKYEEEDDEEAREELKNEIEQYESAFQEADEELVAKIDEYNQKKDFYAERAKKMQEGRKHNKGKAQPETAAAAVAEAQPAQVVSQPATAQPVYAEAGVETKSKDGDSGGWVMWAALGIVGVILGVNLVNRNN